jgi:hypothetical protein
MTKNWEDISVPLHTIDKEELLDILAKIYGVLTEVAKYGHVQNGKCKERRNVLGTEWNRKDSCIIVFSRKVLVQSNNSSLLLIDQTEDPAEVVLQFLLLFF